MTDSLKSSYAIEISSLPANHLEQYMTSSKMEVLQKAEPNEISLAVNKMKPNQRYIDSAKRTDKAIISRKLQLTKQNMQAKAVCSETGIVTLLDIPAIHGYALTYVNPISELPNARGIAQRGIDYLRKLDTQILAGILITLANDYNLFRYQPNDSGAQKNAIIRSIHRDTIITAILLIENSINSSNYPYLPQFSMIWNADCQPGEFDIRFQSYLKLLTEAIYKPDTKVYDENATVRNEKIAYYKAKAKQEKTESSELRRKEKALKYDCKIASTYIKELFKIEKISLKFRSSLLFLYQEFNILTMEEAAKVLLISKLESIMHPSADELILIIKADRAGLTATNNVPDDFFNDIAAPSVTVSTDKVHVMQIVQKVSTVANVIKPDSTVITVKIEPANTLVEGQKYVVLADKKYAVDAAHYDSLSFMDRIKFNKALLAGSVSNATKPVITAAQNVGDATW